MKHLLLTAILLVQGIAFSQDISGDWHGALRVPGAQLRLSLNVMKTDTGYGGKLISVDQGNTSIPLQWIRFTAPDLSFRTSVAGIDYNGRYENGNINGIFKQGGQSFPLSFSRQSVAKTELKRPQEPRPPYPYRTEEVTFRNSTDDIILAGTLTLPPGSGKFPAVILISGSGPQNRDEELMGHKPFLVLADHLTRNGIAVLRYDDRGTAASKGDFSQATSADFARDVLAAVNYLRSRKEIDLKKIGLVGHSEGGLIAPMVAVQSKDVTFIVLLAGTGVPGKEIVLLQQDLIARASGAPAQGIAENRSRMEELIKVLQGTGDELAISSAFDNTLARMYREMPDSLRKQVPEKEFSDQYKRMNTKWFRYFLSYDPAVALEKLKIPVLALNGSKDLQVWPAQNLPPIRKALEKADNRKFTIKELPNLNHLFQEATTGSPLEYEVIEQTMSPMLLNEVTNWIKAQTGT